jgi:hypothetical protein
VLVARVGVTSSLAERAFAPDHAFDPLQETERPDVHEILLPEPSGIDEVDTDMETVGEE